MKKPMNKKPHVIPLAPASSDPVVVGCGQALFAVHPEDFIYS
jgi:hypothetical protein